MSGSGRAASRLPINRSSVFPVVDIRQPGFILPTVAPFSLRTSNALESLQTLAKYWRAQHNLTVIGITGSVGKSSTKELAASVLGSRARTLKNQGNMNNEIGLPLTLLSLNEEHKVAVLEMGFYVSGEIELLCDIAKPQIGIITNIGTVHAERAGSIEDIARGKAELVEALPASPDGLAILNYDDPYVREMASLTAARVFYYGLDPKADLWADEIQSHGLEGIRAVCTSVEFRLRANDRAPPVTPCCGLPRPRSTKDGLGRDF